MASVATPRDLDFLFPLREFDEGARDGGPRIQVYVSFLFPLREFAGLEL